MYELRGCELSGVAAMLFKWTEFQVRKNHWIEQGDVLTGVELSGIDSSFGYSRVERERFFSPNRTDGMLRTLKTMGQEIFTLGSTAESSHVAQPRCGTETMIQVAMTWQNIQVSETVRPVRQTQGWLRNPENKCTPRKRREFFYLQPTSANFPHSWMSNCSKLKSAPPAGWTSRGPPTSLNPTPAPWWQQKHCARTLDAPPTAKSVMLANGSFSDTTVCTVSSALFAA